MRDKKTIWHIGGEDVHMRIPLLQELAGMGFDVAAAGSGRGDAFSQAGIKYYFYPLDRGLSPLQDMRTHSALLQLFRQHAPDLVHGFDTKPAIMTPLCAEKAQIPGRVRTINGMGFVFSSQSLLASSLRPVYRILQRKASSAAGMTIFQNGDDRQYFLANGMVGAENSTIVFGSGVRTFDFAHVKEDALHNDKLRAELGVENKLVVTMISRLVREKGVVEFLAAAEEISRLMGNTVFLLVGPQGTEGRMAVPMSEVSARTSDRVRYLGARDDVSALLGITDVFVLPTHYREGVPRVLLEAGAVGLPLVTTDMPGCREVVRNRWNGNLVPPKDVAELVASILELLNMPATGRQLMGARSRDLVRAKFDLEIVAKAYAKVYRDILSSSLSD